MSRCRLIISLAAFVTAAGCSSRAAKSPEWWRNNRAIYCPFALSGAGGPLMKFPGEDIKDKLRSFDDLPLLLEDARKLGCDCIYLVDYWQGGYENKGDYVPRSDLGGTEAFKRGVAAVHAKGGRIILYLEAFIISRTSDIGRRSGPDWAMMDERGNFYTYYGRDRFYHMYPGDGSGWTEYLCALAEKMVRDYGVDGFHLDSYGCQWDLMDHNPKHPGASDPAKFNHGAVNLVRTLRERIQKIKPEAVVMLECCERTELLDVCDGGQIDSAAWLESPLKVIAKKPWRNEGKYKVFTASFSLAENEKALESGYNLSLSPWWLQRLPEEKDFRKMREPLKKKGDWTKRIRTLWYWDNLLHANGVERPSGIDLYQLRRDLEGKSYQKGVESYDTPSYWKVVETYEPLVRALISSCKRVKTQAEYVRKLIVGR